MTLRNYFRLIAEDRSCGSLWVWFWKPVLKTASFIYSLGFFFHQKFYKAGLLKRKAFQQPVVSVGNITWGGTGKTPLVEYVARFYLHRGKKPLILSRGYGSDEALELTYKLPEARFGVGKNRFREA